MRLGIDASNLRIGGALTHLSELLKAADPRDHGFDEVILWGGLKASSVLPTEMPWLRFVYDQHFDNSLPYRIFWQKRILPELAEESCDILLFPGGMGNSFRPYVTMSRNMLPFESRERSRYGLSWIRCRLELLRWNQARTFERAQGLIFLTRYAREIILSQLKGVVGQSIIIPHGINSRFFSAPRRTEFTSKRPIRILYVSIIDLYKHQWQLVRAVAKLREKGLNVTLQLVGAAYPPAMRCLHRAMVRHDPQKEFVSYSGPIDYFALPEVYQKADLFVFASSCENMPNILIEAMGSGLPIACSNRGPMPEILGDAGVYFDAEKPEEIAEALHRLIDNRRLRDKCAWGAYARAQSYSWTKCAAETLAFLAGVAMEYQHRKSWLPCAV